MAGSFLSDLLASVYGVLRTAAYVAFEFLLLLVASLYRAVMRQKMARIDSSDLSLHLLASRLCDLPYHVDNSDDIAEGIAGLLGDTKLLHFEEQELMGTNAVWYLCSGTLPGGAQAESATFLVFRGTMSPSDAIADVMFRPEAGPNGTQCHGGFLRTVREDKVLHETLRAHVKGRAPLYIMGHSLGGALSQTLVGAGFLPAAFDGPLTVISLGGPAAFCGALPPAALVGPPARARVISIVNGNDIVPRLLGSKLSFTRSFLVALTKSANARKQRQNEQLLETLERYTWFPQTELVFLYGGYAQLVAPDQREYVLNLAEALHPRCIADHLGYVVSLEAAAEAPTRWKPPTACAK